MRTTPFMVAKKSSKNEASLIDLSFFNIKNRGTETTNKNYGAPKKTRTPTPSSEVV